MVDTAAAATVATLRLRDNGTDGILFYTRPALQYITLASKDLGNDVAGSSVWINRNSNVAIGTVGPAPGTLRLNSADNATNFLWTDDSDQLRIHTAAPTGNTGAPTVHANTAGTVVGTQTSHATAKILAAAEPSPAESLNHILDAVREGLRSFTYRSGAFNGERFPIGLVTDLAPRYGMDRDEEHPHGKSLNIPVLFGDLMQSIIYLHNRLESLEGN